MQLQNNVISLISSSIEYEPLILICFEPESDHINCRIQGVWVVSIERNSWLTIEVCSFSHFKTEKKTNISSIWENRFKNTES